MFLRGLRGFYEAPAEGEGTGTPATEGSGTAAPPGTGTSAPAGEGTPKTFTQAEVQAIAAKEARTAKAAAAAAQQERDALSAKLAEYEAKAREAEEAKLSATERAKRDAEREKAATEKRIADAEARAARAESARVDTHLGYQAQARVASIAAKLFNAELAPDVAETVKRALSIHRDDATGAETVMIQLGTATGDTEPLTDATWAKFCDARLARYFGTAGGSGAAHGRGAGAGANAYQNLPPTDRIRKGLEGR